MEKAAEKKKKSIAEQTNAHLNSLSGFSFNHWSEKIVNLVRVNESITINMLKKVHWLEQ